MFLIYQTCGSYSDKSWCPIAAIETQELAGTLTDCLNDIQIFLEQSYKEVYNPWLNEYLTNHPAPVRPTVKKAGRQPAMPEDLRNIPKKLRREHPYQAAFSKLLEEYNEQRLELEQQSKQEYEIWINDYEAWQKAMRSATASLYDEKVFPELKNKLGCHYEQFSHLFGLPRDGFAYYADCSFNYSEVPLVQTPGSDNGSSMEN